MPSASFSDNEKVLCFHGPLLYEAKCIKSRAKAGCVDEREYLVHYQGWNKNWDEWVGDTRILRYNADNLDRKKRLMSEHVSGVQDSKRSRSTRSGKSAPSGGPYTGPPPPSPVPVELLTDADVKQINEEVFEPSATSAEIEVAVDEQYSVAFPSVPALCLSETEIVVPEELKYVLVSDRDLILNKGSVFQLPAKNSASSILDDFARLLSSAATAPPVSKRVSSRKSMPTSQAKTENNLQAILGKSPSPHLDSFVVDSVLKSFKSIFDSLLPSLLYKQERKQLSDMDSELKCGRPSDLYGSAHLLRLIAVQLSQFLAQTVLPVHQVMSSSYNDAENCEYADLTSAEEDDDKSVTGSSIAPSETDDTEDDDMEPLSDLDSLTIGPVYPTNYLLTVAVANSFLRFLDINRTKYFTSKNYV